MQQIMTEINNWSKSLSNMMAIIDWGLGGSSEKTFHGGSMNIFWNNTIPVCTVPTDHDISPGIKFIRSWPMYYISQHTYKAQTCSTVIENT